MKRLILLSLTALCAIALTAGAYFIGQESFLQFQYDRKHYNPKAQTQKQIDSVFRSLETISFKNLPIQYLDKTHSSKSAYKQKLANRTYYKLTRDDLFKKVVGNYRLKHFVCKDLSYQKCMRTKGSFYTCIDKKVLGKFLFLLNTLEDQGYNINAIKLRSAHRHPKRNYYIGGASQSRHIYGQAIDVAVGDINNDNKANKEDKQIVLDLLENKIIKNEGGIGLYPGTKSVHFDTRGHRARWNTYTPAIKK